MGREGLYSARSKKFKDACVRTYARVINQIDDLPFTKLCSKSLNLEPESAFSLEPRKTSRPVGPGRQTSRPEMDRVLPVPACSGSSGRKSSENDGFPRKADTSRRLLPQNDHGPCVLG